MSKPQRISSWGQEVTLQLAQFDPKQFGRVGVLMGGRSAEREISLLSGQGVLNALLEKGIDAHAFDPGVRSPVDISKEQFDRVFIALHGRYGEDGTFKVFSSYLIFHIPAVVFWPLRYRLIRWLPSKFG